MSVSFRKFGCLATVLIGLALPVSALERLEFAVVGAERTLTRDLQNSSLLVAAVREDRKDAQSLLAAAQAEYGRLLGTLYAAGYYGGTISVRIDGREAAEISPLRAPDNIAIIAVEIRPGSVYGLERAGLGPIAPGSDLPAEFRPGAPAGTDVIRDAALAAIDGWRDRSHAKADVDAQRIVADHRARRVTADIRIDPGPPLRFGALNISGQNRTRDSRIRDIAGLPSGKPFSPEAAQAVADRVRRTGTFRSVSLREADTPNPDGTLDFDLVVAEEQTRRYGAGAEIASDEGITLSAFWMHRNLFRGAERLRFDGEVSGIAGNTAGLDYTLGVRFQRPATTAAANDLALYGELERLNQPEFTSETITLGAELTRRASQTASFGVGVELSLSDESSAAGDVTFRHLFFPLSATLDRRDGPLDTREGAFVDVEIAPFVGFAASDSGVRTTVDARAYEAFGSRLVVAGRLQFGSIAGAKITGLPNDLRFFSGGGGTVRGQDFQALGVDLGGGATSGGRSFLGLSGEARVDVTDLISVVGFADWGFVGPDSLPNGDGDSHAGAGLGLRYNTGIGPIRLDVAIPVSGTPGGSEYQFYIGIGQAF